MGMVEGDNECISEFRRSLVWEDEHGTYLKVLRGLESRLYEVSGNHGHLTLQDCLCFSLTEKGDLETAYLEEHFRNQRKIAFEYHSVYDIAVAYLCHSNKATRIIASTLYLCNPNVQVPYINDVRTQIIKHFDDDTVPIYKGQIEAYMFLGLLYENKAYIQNKDNENNISEALQEYIKFGWNYDKLVCCITLGIMYLEMDIARELIGLQWYIIKNYHIGIRGSYNWLPQFSFCHQ